MFKGLQQDNEWVCECVDVANVHVGWSAEMNQNQRYLSTVRNEIIWRHNSSAKPKEITQVSSNIQQNTAQNTEGVMKNVVLMTELQTSSEQWIYT